MKNIHRPITLLLMALLILSLFLPTTVSAIAPSSNGGEIASAVLQSETPIDYSDYIEIATKQDLAQINNNLAGKYVLTADLEFTASDFEKRGEFYNSGQGWKPIGTTSKTAFTGIFDGNGHSITGLKYDYAPSKTIATGLFGYIDGATIRNLNLQDASIRLTVSSTKTDYSIAYVGGIAGYVLNSTIANCRTSGSFSASAKSPYLKDEYTVPYAGGIAGYISNSTIINCHNSGAVSETASSGDPGPYIYLGGIVGYARSNSTISCCTNTGNVSSTLTSNCPSDSSLIYTGGIVGYLRESTVVTCYNTGKVSDTSSSKYGLLYVYVGGIVGVSSSSSTVSTCRNTGSVNESASMKSSGPSISGHAGGIAGIVQYGSSMDNCYNSGDVRIHLSTSYQFGAISAGGIAGFVNDESVLGNVYNVGQVRATTSSSSSSASPSTYAFGICRASSDSLVENSYYRIDALENGTAYDNAFTTEQMKQQEMFAGFDFDTVWAMDPNADYPYPTLRSLVNLPPHVHSWSQNWSFDDHAHWHECTEEECPITSSGDMDGYAVHTPAADDNNCATAVSCTVCGRYVIPRKKHTYSNDCDPTCNNEGCAYTRDVTHTPAADDADCSTPIPCAVCGEILTEGLTHTYTNECDESCNNEGCTYIRVVTHTPEADDGDCTTPIQCTVCGEIATPAMPDHTYTDDVDATCNACDHVRTITTTDPTTETTSPQSPDPDTPPDTDDTATPAETSGTSEVPVDSTATTNEEQTIAATETTPSGAATDATSGTSNPTDDNVLETSCSSIVIPNLAVALIAGMLTTGLILRKKRG